MIAALSDFSPNVLAGGAAAAVAALAIGFVLLRRALARRKARKAAADPTLALVSAAAARAGADIDAEKRPDALERLAGRKGVQANWVLAAAMVCSGALTFGGNLLEMERTGGASLETTLWAGMVAMVVTALQWVAWTTAMALTPKMRTIWRKIAGLLLAFLLLGWTYYTSSLYNFMSLTSGSALTAHLFEETEQRRTVLERVDARAQASRKLEPFVTGEAAYYCPLSEREAAEGVFSGSQGGGMVAATLAGLCLESRNAETILAAAIAAAESGSAETATALRAMAAALEATDAPMFQRERRWREAALRFDERIRALRGADMLSSLETWVRTLKSSVQTMPTADSAFGRKQSEVLAALRGRLEERITPIEGLIAELRGADLPEPERRRPPSLSEVTLAQAGANLPALAVAFGIDTAPLLLFLYFLLAERPRGRPSRGLEEMAVRTPGLPRAARKPGNDNRPADAA